MKRSLGSIKQEVEHAVIKGLTHAASYNAEEILEVASFLSRLFGVDFENADALGQLRNFVAKQDAALKSWEDLSESETDACGPAWHPNCGRLGRGDWEDLGSELGAVILPSRQAAQGLGFTQES